MKLINLIKLINIRGLLCYYRIHWLQSSKLLKWNLKFGVLNVYFKITSKVQLGDASKLLFVLISDCREGIIAFFYLFDLFKSPLIIPISYNSFKYDSNKSFETIVNVNPESIQITVFSDISSNTIV